MHVCVCVFVCVFEGEGGRRRREREGDGWMWVPWVISNPMAIICLSWVAAILFKSTPLLYAAHSANLNPFFQT